MKYLAPIFFAILAHYLAACYVVFDFITLETMGVWTTNERIWYLTTIPHFVAVAFIFAAVKNRKKKPENWHRPLSWIEKLPAGKPW